MASNNRATSFNRLLQFLAVYIITAFSFEHDFVFVARLLLGEPSKISILQRTGQTNPTYFIRGSIIVVWQPFGFGFFGFVELAINLLNGQIQMSQTGGQPYSDTWV